jgi:hypothetical protein
VTRLTHSENAFVRVLQMTRADTILFVEGWTDRFFYDQLASIECHARNIKYDIRTAQDLAGDGDGKPKLLSLFRLLKKRRRLFAASRGRASAFFFFDKDLDDLRNTVVRSRHVAYTEPFNVESYYFIAGDLVRAAAASASLETELLRGAFGDNLDWRRSCANAWSRWVELCLHAALDNLRCSSHYRSDSNIHTGCFVKPDQERYKAALLELQKASSLSQSKFRRRHSEMRAIVKTHYSEGRHDAIFNGKWYRGFAQATVSAAAQDRRSSASTVANRISANLLLTMDFNDAWSLGLRRPLGRLVSRLQKRV